MIKIGTRGAFGVVVDGVEKIGYNQYDSYPEGHGVENLQWIRSIIERGFEGDMRAMAHDAELVNDDTPITPADIEHLSDYTDLGVSAQSTDDWYCLTRGTHGHIGQMVECGYILDASDFVTDTLFCEWAYVVDFDKRTFEVYSDRRDGRGAGRWDHMGGVPLIAVYSFDDLPTDDNFLLDTVGPECSDCTYRRPADEGKTVDGVFTCQYCVDDKVAV